jgi:hypothetical protein
MTSISRDAAPPLSIAPHILSIDAIDDFVLCLFAGDAAGDYRLSGAQLPKSPICRFEEDQPDAGAPRAGGPAAGRLLPSRGDSMGTLPRRSIPSAHKKGSAEIAT